MSRTLAACVFVLWSACETSATKPEPSPQPSRTSQSTQGARSVPPSGLDQAMRVVLLGTGTPIPDPARAGPCTAVVVGGRPYLVDAGPDVVRQAEAARLEGVTALNPRRLDRLFLTHLHSDHTVGLPDLLRSPAVVGRVRPLEVHGPPGTAAMIDHLRDAYRLDQRIRFEVEGERAGYQVAAHDDEPGTVYRDERVTVKAFAVAHGRFEHAFGYAFEGGGRRVVVSGDTTATDAVAGACDGCDVLVHEVYCAAGLAGLDARVRNYHEAFHTSGPELAALASRAKPKLLVLTHLLTFGCTPLQLLAEVRRGYDGEVVVGEDLGIY